MGEGHIIEEPKCFIYSQRYLLTLTVHLICCGTVICAGNQIRLMVVELHI